MVNIDEHEKYFLELEEQQQLSIGLSNQDNYEQIKVIQKELSNIKQIDVLTPELLHRLIEKIEIKQTVLRGSFIDSRCHLLLFNVILATRSTPHV